MSAAAASLLGARISFKDLDAKTIETINYLQTDTVGMLYAGSRASQLESTPVVADDAGSMHGYGLRHKDHLRDGRLYKRRYDSQHRFQCDPA